MVKRVQPKQEGIQICFLIVSTKEFKESIDNYLFLTNIRFVSDFMTSFIHDFISSCFHCLKEFLLIVFNALEHFRKLFKAIQIIN